MPKCTIINRLLHLRISTCMFSILCLIAVIQFFASYGKYNYRHLPAEVIQTQLYKQIVPNLGLKVSKPDCQYDHILKSKNSINAWDIPKRDDDFVATGVVNGSYVPEACNPKFSVAILVTYRNRQRQLEVFMPYMHNFLRKQNIHYKIYLIEQQDEKPWNKGMLYNIGAKQAIADKFPCLILHDVDMLPLDDSNLYACTGEPRHMSASLDKFRYVLTYDYLVGGVLAIRSDQFVMLNGFSNKFQGWGGEDDDFAARIQAHQLSIVRFPREMSRYTMLPHRPESKNSERGRVMSANRRQRAAGAAGAAGAADGLSSASGRSVAVHDQRLFALLGVHL